MIANYSLVQAVLADPALYASDVPSRRGARFDWLLFLDPPDHARRRTLVGKAFCPRSIARFEGRIAELSGRLLDRVMPRGQMDVTQDFAEPLPLMVLADLFGLPPADWPRLRRWSHATVTLAESVVRTEPAGPEIGDGFRAASAEIADEIARLLAERRADPRDDLLTGLALAEVDGGSLSGEEIVRFFQVLLAAGTETATNLIANAVLCFLEHPDELARLRAAPGLLGAGIEEVLRYRSPVQAAFRVTRGPVELGGQQIPAGELLLLALGAANRDPEHFAEPDRFDLSRDPNPHLGFGHGTHACLGASLARLQTRVALGALLSRLETFRLASDLPFEPRRAFYLHGPARLPIVFQPASAAPSRSPLRDE